MKKRGTEGKAEMCVKTGSVLELLMWLCLRCYNVVIIILVITSSTAMIFLAGSTI